MGCGGSTATGSATIEETSPSNKQKRADAYAVKTGPTPLDNKAWGAAEPSGTKCASPIKKNPTKVRPTPGRPFRRVNTFDELLTTPRGEACVSNMPQPKVDFRSISRHSRPVAQMVNAMVTGYVTLARHLKSGDADADAEAALRRVRMDIAPGFTLFLTAAENDALKQSEAERPSKKEKKGAGKAEPGSPLGPTPPLQKILGARLRKVEIRAFRLRVVGGYRHQVLGVALTHDESMLCVSLSTVRVPVGRLHPQQATPGNLMLGSSPSGMLLGESSLGSSLLGGAPQSVHAKPINLSPSVLTLGSEIAEQAKQLREPRLYLMDMRTGSNLGPFMPSRPCIQERVADMVFGWREERLYSCNDEGTVQTWLLSKRRQGPSLKQKADVPPMIACMCVKTNADETLIGTCGENSEQNSRGQVALWSVDTGEHVLSFMLHPKCVTSFDFHPNGSVVASGDQKGTILVWRTNDGTALRAILGHRLAIKTIRFYLDVSSESGTAAAPAESFEQASQHVCLTCERLLVSDDKHVRMWSFPDLSLERNSIEDSDAWKPGSGGNVDRVLPLWTRTVDEPSVPYEENDGEVSMSATDEEEASSESWSDDNEYSCEDLLYKTKPSVVLKKVSTRRRVTVALPIPSGYMLYCQYGPAGDSLPSVISEGQQGCLVDSSSRI